MNDLPRYSSSLGKNLLHLCFKAKYCHKIFDDQKVEEKCKEVFREVEEELGIEIQEIGFDRDHVHMAVDIGMKYALCYVVKRLKGRASRVLMQEFPYLRKFFSGKVSYGIQATTLNQQEKTNKKSKTM